MEKQRHVRNHYVDLASRLFRVKEMIRVKQAFKIDLEFIAFQCSC